MDHLLNQPYARTWWGTLLNPKYAADVILHCRIPFFATFLAVACGACYCVYGFTMGLFTGAFPSMVSAIKLPFMFIFTVLICLTPFFVLNVYFGPRLTLRQCSRLLLLSLSINAMALASYVPVSAFFMLV